MGAWLVHLRCQMNGVGVFWEANNGNLIPDGPILDLCLVRLAERALQWRCDLHALLLHGKGV